MIPLNLSALAEAQHPFVTRLRLDAEDMDGDADSVLVMEDGDGASFSGPFGLLSIDGLSAQAISGDVLLVQPDMGRAERLLRSGSPHNTLLLTERCDQLCIMCSQPPKKTHVDRFAHFEKACLLAEPDSVIGLTGGEPTLYKAQLLGMIEHVLSRRADLEFHVLTNGQHFDENDVERLCSPLYRRVSWGVPLYAEQPSLHDRIVGKDGAFRRLHESFAILMRAGARIELRTVLLSDNLECLSALARYVAAKLRFIECWSIMQLEKIGFARNRWDHLFVNHAGSFHDVAQAVDTATLHGTVVRLFNFPRCTVPAAYRHLAPASISDWKRKYLSPCDTCQEKAKCCGFFEWHPDDQALAQVTPL